MNYVFDFTLCIDHLPPDTFRLVYLDCQNDSPSQDVECVVRAFSVNAYDISEWGLKKASLYLQDELLHTGLLVGGKAYGKAFEGYFYEFIVASPFALFKTRGPNRVFVDKTVDEIINAVLLSAGWLASQWHWELAQPLPKLAYRVQYHQSDYDFMLELLSEFKLNFVFENGLCVLSDKISIQTITHHVESPQPYRRKMASTFLGYHFEKSFQPGLFFATVEAPDTQQPYLNQDGHYRIRWDFDNTSAPCEGSSPIPFISPHFMHFPLRNGTRVAVRCLEGKMHQPIIMGVIPTEDPEPEHYTHRSYAEHEFTLTPEKIVLMHGCHKTQMTLSRDSVCDVEAGSLVCMAGENLSYETQQNLEQMVQHSHILNVHQEQRLHVKGEIVFEIAANLSFSAQQNCYARVKDIISCESEVSQYSAKKIIFTATQQLNLNAEGSMLLLGRDIRGDSACVSLRGGDVNIVMMAGGLVLNAPLLSVNAGVISGIPMPG